MTGSVDEPMVYHIVGPQFFVDLVDRFYDGVEADPVLLPLYPEGSTTQGARERLAMFLAQYWGGPHDYMEKRGHPMLRMRHAEFSIGERERDRWLVHMFTALDETVRGANLDEATRDQVLSQVATYMVNAAEHLRNT
jgi:hemoglobin